MNIDELSISIQSDSASASDGLNRLLDTLGRIQGAVAPATAAIRDLGAALKQFSNVSINNVNLKPFEKTMGIIGQAIGKIPADASARLQGIQEFMSGIGSLGQGIDARSMEGVARVPEILGGIVQSVQSISDADIQRINSLAVALENLNNSGGLGQIQQTMGRSVSRSSGGAGGGLGFGLGGIFRGFQTGFGLLGRAAKVGIQAAMTPLEMLRDRIKSATSGILTFGHSLARIAGYRFLRTLIKEITSGASEGLQNLAHASAEANANLSKLSSASLTMKNSLGGALYSALYPLISVLQTIANAAANALNWISQLFAILGGRATYMRATNATKEWAKATGGAAGAAKALKQELMGFDEINSLTPDGGGGGGGGGGALDYAEMFEESPVSSWLKDMVDKGDFTEMGRVMARKINEALDSINWEQIKNNAVNVAQSFATLITGLFDPDENEGLDPDVMGRTIAGFITAGAEAALTFWDQTPWYDIGRQMKEWLLKAAGEIDAVKLGQAVMGKFKAGILFFQGLIPNTKAEWDLVASKISDFVTGAINDMPTDALGEALGNTINTALTTAKALANAETLYSIAKKITTGIKTAVGVIDKDTLKEAMTSFGSDLGKALNELIKGIPDDFIGTALAGLVNGALAGIDTLAEKKTLTTLGWKIVSAIQSAFANIDWTLALVTAGHVFEDFGGMLLTVFSGLLKLDIDVGGIEINVVGAALLAATLGNQMVTSLGPYFKSFGRGTGNVLSFVGGVYFLIDAFVGIGELYKSVTSGAGWSWDQFADIIGDAITSAGFFMMSFGHPVGGALAIGLGLLIKLIPKIDWEDVKNQLFSKPQISHEDFLKLQRGEITEAELELKYNPQYIEFTSSIETAHTGLTGSFGAVTESANETTTAMDGLTQQTAAYGAELQSVVGTKEVKNIGSADKGIGNIAESTEDATKELQAMGSEAEEVMNSIVMIPTEREIVMTIRNYATLMANLGLIKSRMDEINRTKLKVQVQVTLSAASKLFLQRLSQLDATMSDKLQSIISASDSAALGYAAGGYPKAGQLYRANENGVGSELIGQIGSRHAVANSEQIGDAIFRYMDEHDRESGDGMTTEAMAAAMAAAIRATGLGATYLDGRMLAQSINRASRQAGKPVLNF